MEGIIRDEGESREQKTEGGRREAEGGEG